VISPSRLVALAALASVALAGIGLTAELAKFGRTPAATAAKLEREVRQAVTARARAVEQLAQHVAERPDLVASAARDRERVAELFDHLLRLTAPRDAVATTATIYLPGPRSTLATPLAWSRGPGEQPPPPDRLSSAPVLYVAPGHGGMRLVYVQPVVFEGIRIASAVAETILAPGDRSPASLARRLETSFGPATILEQYVTSRDENSIPNGFVIAGPDDTPLLVVTFDPEELARRRRVFREHALALSLAPLIVAVGLLIPSPLRARTRSPFRRDWWRPLLAASALVAGSAGLLYAAAWLYGAGPTARVGIGATALLGFAMVLAGGWWWRPRRRTGVGASPVRFAAEQLLAGLVIAGGVELVARVVSHWISTETLERWQFVLFPFDASAVLALATLLILQLTIAWSTGSVVAAIAGRWNWRSHPLVVVSTIGLWAAPAVAVVVWPGSAAHRTSVATSIAIAAAVTFGFTAEPLRRFYRRTTQSMRLVLGLLTVAIPLVALYPIGAVTADRVTRRVIESDYAPATADHPRQLRAELARAEADIDQFPSLIDLVAGPPYSETTDTQAAFRVWNHTNLSRARVVSDVELYGADGSLVSRFAFNLPEFVYRTTEQWQATSCEWDVFGELSPFGGESRRLLHAMKGVCDPNGAIRGGIVVHVAYIDYQALPFVASASPYNAVVEGLDAPAPQPLPDLDVAVYGWSYQPIFTSGEVGWVVPRSVFEALYATGQPFWTSLSSDDRTFQVHFSQNRNGVYAVGYRRPNAFEHATRLAEIFAIAALLFIVLQIAAMASAPLVRRGQAPLGRLFHEVRTSFYRKLFLFFVAAAVVPVIFFAVAFDRYMTARFRADVESEARTTVAVARRVFDELAAANARTDTPIAAPSDDLMVWIRQVIGQDVNLFEGPNLVATSQRDLFDSELLPTRTPAGVYRSVVLEHRPIAVVEDRVGNFTYLVAAAPVPGRGHEAILTVPLAPRQREIARETDELNRGVLVGSVLVVLLAAAVGASLASRIANPVGRLTRATRQIAAGNLDVRVTTDTADELRRLVDDFNSMAETLGAQRSELARTNQLKAWNEMARQVAHEIKNPLTPIQLSAEHLQHVHEDRGRPMGDVVDQCLRTILGQVRLLRRIASEFSNFAGEARLRPGLLAIDDLITTVVDPYRAGIAGHIVFDVEVPAALPAAWADRTLVARALTNLVENAIQAMPAGGRVHIRAESSDAMIVITVADTGVGMDQQALSRAFDPFFSTKTGGSGLGLANAQRNIEMSGGRITIASAAGAGTTVTVSLPLASPSPIETG
jgi:signal transduction histidine kinase